MDGFSHVIANMKPLPMEDDAGRAITVPPYSFDIAFRKNHAADAAAIIHGIYAQRNDVLLKAMEPDDGDEVPFSGDDATASISASMADGAVEKIVLSLIFVPGMDEETKEIVRKDAIIALADADSVNIMVGALVQYGLATGDQSMMRIAMSMPPGGDGDSGED